MPPSGPVPASRSAMSACVPCAGGTPRATLMTTLPQRGFRVRVARSTRVWPPRTIPPFGFPKRFPSPPARTTPIVCAMSRSYNGSMERVVLFARVPRLGAVKTRLTPPLSEEEALALHEAMLHDQIAFVASFVGPGRTAEICLDARWPADRPRPAGPPALPTTLQGEGSLGSRLERTLARGHAGGTKRIAIVGSDAPTLPARLVEDAFSRLAGGADAVVTPARDGGYVLIATSGRHPALFRDVPWGTGDVLDVTRRRARDAGIDLQETEGWFDVDRVEDFEALLEETQREEVRAPRTALLAPTLRLYLPERPVL